ncbi:hypothetical protein QLL95_gp1154 [Cotonvirus japonicus]|uniref:Uncharacterized protein n=1 Tax=Cotonvirus japonicus TaxID=2811091 RepID=A0ABM7NS40_9VIRU|nr:hypothetical protein QLL95_gp1154 [Cotonvirus japonicus]BCS82969.1 hypothetical protein [Cotonvirus japonicus]
MYKGFIDRKNLSSSKPGVYITTDDISGYKKVRCHRKTESGRETIQALAHLLIPAKSEVAIGENFPKSESLRAEKAYVLEITKDGLLIDNDFVCKSYYSYSRGIIYKTPGKVKPRNGFNRYMFDDTDDQINVCITKEEAEKY